MHFVSNAGGSVYFKASKPATDGSLATGPTYGGAMQSHGLTLLAEALANDAWRSALRRLFIDFANCVDAVLATAEVVEARGQSLFHWRADAPVDRDRIMAGLRASDREPRPRLFRRKNNHPPAQQRGAEVARRPRYHDPHPGPLAEPTVLLPRAYPQRPEATNPPAPGLLTARRRLAEAGMTVSHRLISLGWAACGSRRGT